MKLKEDLRISTVELDDTKKMLTQSKVRQENLERELAVATESASLANAKLRKTADVEKSRKILSELQHIWGVVGISIDDREAARHQIESSVEDTCLRMLEDSRRLRATTKEEIEELSSKLTTICTALGRTELISALSEPNFNEKSMTEHLESLKEKMRDIHPSYLEAMERKSSLKEEARKLINVMELSDDEVSSTIQELMRPHDVAMGEESHHAPKKPVNKSGKEYRAEVSNYVEALVKALETSEPLDGEETTMKSDTDISSSLSSDFLDESENDVRKLKLLKSNILAENEEKRLRGSKLAHEMKLSERNIMSHVTQSMKRQNKNLPKWWDASIAEDVSRSFTREDCIVGVSKSYSRHHDIILASLQEISVGRHEMSELLMRIVEKTRMKLNELFEGMIDMKGMQEEWREALSRVPKLSKDHIFSCISEMGALAIGIDSITSEEIESLTHVWGKLNVSSGNRANFWQEVAEVAAREETEDTPFDSIFQNGVHVENWLASALGDAKESYKTLSIRLSKLDKVHEEVEKLRSMQDIQHKIISRDSEIRILSAKMSDFEREAGNKDRFLSKKMSSAALLEEERFRKHMQATFASKLESVRNLLQEWQRYGKEFDSVLLSEEVKGVLHNSDSSDDWVEERTAFMHLSTVKKKSTRKLDRARSKSPRNERERSRIPNGLSRPRAPLPSSPTHREPEKRGRPAKLSKAAATARKRTSVVSRPRTPFVKNERTSPQLTRRKQIGDCEETARQKSPRRKTMRSRMGDRKTISVNIARTLDNNENRRPNANRSDDDVCLKGKKQKRLEISPDAERMMASPFAHVLSTPTADKCEE